MKYFAPPVIRPLIVASSLALCLMAGCTSTKSPSAPPVNAEMSDELERLGAMYVGRTGIPAKGDEDLPPSFRGVVPLYKGVIVSNIREHQGLQQTGEKVYFRADAPPEKIAEFYRKAMKERGWEEQWAGKTRKKEIIFTKVDQVFKVQISPPRKSQGRTAVTLMLYRVVPEQEDVKLPPLIKEMVPIMQDSKVEDATSSEINESAELSVKASGDEIAAFYKKALAGKSWKLKDEKKSGHLRLWYRRIYKGRELTLFLGIYGQSAATQKTRVRVMLRWE